MSSHSRDNPFVLALCASAATFFLATIAFLSIFVSPLNVLGAIAGTAAVWTIIRYPVGTLGALLAFMPIDYLAIELGKFFGIPHMTMVSACTKEIPLLLLILVLWRRNGFKPAAPDWFLVTYCAIATVYTLIAGSWAALAFDLNLAIPYFVGRMTVLSEGQDQKWARRAVWILGVLAVLGLSEVFIFGPGPRTVLYMATDAMTEDGGLTASFHAIGFNGLREASTMAGPPTFGPLCMIALVLWWVYCRNPLPGAMIAVGLICSVTRSAWLASGLAIPILALITHQKKRFFLYTLLALALFAASIPILGLGDYLFFNKTGQDPSAEWHRDAIVNGLVYAAEHPFGSGNAKFSRLAVAENNNVLIFESTYSSLAASYGIPALLCFVGFLLSALGMTWRMKSNLGYAAVGILIGIITVMAFSIPFDDRRLACWAWFPVGLAVQCSLNRRNRDLSESSGNRDGANFVRMPER